MIIAPKLNILNAFVRLYVCSHYYYYIKIFIYSKRWWGKKERKKEERRKKEKNERWSKVNETVPNFEQMLDKWMYNYVCLRVYNDVRYVPCSCCYFSLFDSQFSTENISNAGIYAIFTKHTPNTQRADHICV